MTAAIALIVLGRDKKLISAACEAVGAKVPRPSALSPQAPACCALENVSLILRCVDLLSKGGFM